MKWPRRFTLFAALAAVVLLIASPSILYRGRVAYFDSVCTLVVSQGGTLSLDLQGDYSFHLAGSSASDESIRKLIPHLRSLPSGFTFVGPGEGRNFYVQISGSSISAQGLNELCTLSISSLILIDCPNLQDDAVDALLTLQNPNAMISGDVRLSSDALKRLRRKMWNAFPNVSG